MRAQKAAYMRSQEQHCARGCSPTPFDYVALPHARSADQHAFYIFVIIV
jgi:hypothetical protein